MRRTSLPVRLVRLVSLALLISLAGACGDDDKPTAKQAPAQDGADAAADLAAAQRANLVAADFPSGWSAKPHEKLPGEDELRSDIAACLGISSPSTRAIAEARSPDFTQALATASSTITFVKSKEEAMADAAAFSSDSFGGCAEPGLGKQMNEVGPEGNTVVDLKSERLDFPTLGDHSVANRVSAKIAFGEAKIPVNIDIIRIFKGRAEVELVVVAPGTPFPTDFVSGLAAALAGRL